MIEFDTLAMKADIDELHAIFLLKKNIQQDIIKKILGYLPMAMPESLKEWKVAITSVEQGYESTVSQIRYSLVVILKLNGVSEVQYKDVMMIDDRKYQ